MIVNLNQYESMNITIMKTIRDLKLNVKKMKEMKNVSESDEDKCFSMENKKVEQTDTDDKQIEYFSEVVFGVNHNTILRTNSIGSVGSCSDMVRSDVVANLTASLSTGSSYCLSRSSSSGAGFSSNSSSINVSVHPFSII